MLCVYDSCMLCCFYIFVWLFVRMLDVPSGFQYGRRLGSVCLLVLCDIMCIFLVLLYLLVVFVLLLCLLFAIVCWCLIVVLLCLVCVERMSSCVVFDIVAV